MSLFLLSDDILRSHVFPFFDVTDLDEFDTAMTSKIHRQRWLRILKGVEFSSSSPISHVSVIDWMKKKNLFVTDIKIAKAKLSVVYTVSHTFHDLRSLEVSGGVDNLAIASVIYGCPRLRSLTLKSNDLDNRALAILGATCPQLESLKITSSFTSDFGISDLARGCHELRVLEVNSEVDDTLLPNIIFTVQQYTDASLSALGEHCPHLKELALRSSGTLFSDDGVSKLAACTGLRSLTLQPSNNISEISIAHLASHCSQLCCLDMSNLTDNAIRSLGQNLSVLRIPHSTISDATLLTLASPNLRNLSLSHIVTISDATLQHLASKCPLLTSIELRECTSLTDSGMLSLAQCCSLLVTIDIGNNPNITDKTIIAIARGCPNLKKLLIDNCENLSNVCMVAISHFCKHLEFLNTICCYEITVDCLTSFIGGCPKLRDLRMSGPLWYGGDYENPEAALNRERPEINLYAPY